MAVFHRNVARIKKVYVVEEIDERGKIQIYCLTLMETVELYPRPKIFPRLFGI